MLQAADGDLQAGDALLAVDRRRAARADRVHERTEFGAQRLGITDREVAHRIASVGLKPEIFRDLARQQVADDVFALGRDLHGARLKRREPIGVDVGEHAGRGAELQERDVFAFGARAGKLRLHLDDFRSGEPADQVDVVHGEIDHDADIRHARRKRADPRDRDRQDVLAANRVLDGLRRRIETLDVPNHEDNAGAAGGLDHVVALLDRGGDRLFHEHVHAAGDAGQREVAMQVCRGGYGDRVDAVIEELAHIGKGAAAEGAADELSLTDVGIGNADEFGAGKLGEDAGVVASHDTGANDADANRPVQVFFSVPPRHCELCDLPRWGNFYHAAALLGDGNPRFSYTF